jgi:hypothetical protein
MWHYECPSTPRSPHASVYLDPRFDAAIATGDVTIVSCEPRPPTSLDSRPSRRIIQQAARVPGRWSCGLSMYCAICFTEHRGGLARSTWPVVWWISSPGPVVCSV